jgi:immune inhibitor A
MRKVGAGLGSLALAAGLATTFALSAGAAPPVGSSVQRAVADELPNPAEEKRRALREVALQKVLAGDAKVRRRGASRVVKVARANGEDQYVELARSKTDKIFVILAEFGDTRRSRAPSPRPPRATASTA